MCVWVGVGERGMNRADKWEGLSKYCNFGKGSVQGINYLW